MSILYLPTCHVIQGYRPMWVFYLPINGSRCPIIQGYRPMSISYLRPTCHVIQETNGMADDYSDINVYQVCWWKKKMINLLYAVIICYYFVRDYCQWCASPSPFASSPCKVFHEKCPAFLYCCTRLACPVLVCILLLLAYTRLPACSAFVKCNNLVQLTM